MGFTIYQELEFHVHERKDLLVSWIYVYAKLTTFHIEHSFFQSWATIFPGMICRASGNSVVLKALYDVFRSNSACSLS